MARRTRKSFVAGSGGLFALAGFRHTAGAAEFTYKLGTDFAPTLPASTLVAEAAEKVKRESGGRLEFQVYPNSQLGLDPQLIEQLRLGAIEFCGTGYQPLSSVSPAMGIDGLPYIYDSPQTAWRARDGALGAYLRSELAKINIYQFEKTHDFGFRQIFNSVRPITVPDDLKGLKLRVPTDPDVVLTFKTLGAVPTPMNASELYTGLQTKVIDGGDLPVSPILARKLNEVTKYLSFTNHTATGVMVTANMDAWKRLGKRLQEICDRNFNAAALAQRQAMIHDQDSDEASLKSKGMLVNRPDLKAFKAVIQRAGLYAKWKEQFGPRAWSLLERATGPLG